MPLALNNEHRVLADVAAAFLAERGSLGAAHATLDAPRDALPAFWPEMAALGWLGLHVSSEHGGQGFGYEELAIVVEALGAALTPGPFLATSIASALIELRGDDELRGALLPALTTGELVGAVGFEGSLTRHSDTGVAGDAGRVLGGGAADVLLLPMGKHLAVIDREHVQVELLDSLDPTCPFAAVQVHGPFRGVLTDARRTAVRLCRALAAAEAAGIARACTSLAVEYAKAREQFGRPIGSFQAVKHHCANMFTDTETAVASAWGAVRRVHRDDAEAELAAAAAAAHALPAALRCVERNVQLHGGIGFTWEHPAHLYLRRAFALAGLLDPRLAARDVTQMSLDGASWTPDVTLPEEAERYRADARAARARINALPPEARHRELVTSGYFVPHWPEPWGRGADAMEQLVIEEEFVGVERLDLGIGAWVVLTLAQVGTEGQRERWIRSSLEGSMRWCQLFSEPDAGSDAAAIKTRAVRVDGGWRVSGQKVWTSDAANCTMGLATVRTDPDAPKHAGVSMMAIDLHGPGVDVRPLREITGRTHFNEVFLDDVFVPDEDVVGTVGEGWAVARATLGNERHTIGASSEQSERPEAPDLLDVLRRCAPTCSEQEVGVLLAEHMALREMNVRHALAAMAAGNAGSDPSVAKLFAAEHGQRVAALAIALGGIRAVAGDEPFLARGYLFSRCLTIAGGTSEVLRNVIAERVLGLPREPSRL